MPQYHVSLDQFTGPLDLLLHLIRTAEMDILELDLARLTEDYLAFIDREGVRDLAGAYHFLALAASLVELKSRLLLPQPPRAEGEEDAEELDPRAELIRRLTAYQDIQEVTGELAQRYEQVGHHWPRQVLEQLEAEIVYTMDSLSVYDLMSAFGEVLARPRFRQITIFKEDYDVDEARDWVRQRLAAGPAPLIEMLSVQPDVITLITTFIALLELIKAEEVLFEQGDGGIMLTRSQGEL